MDGARDTSAPFTHTLDTTTLADGVYDLRAIGLDAFANQSAPSVVANVRVDNTAPSLISSTPADGSVSASANEVVMTANEPVLLIDARHNGTPIAVPATRAATTTFATGALADGLHVFSGKLEDASGTRVPYRFAVTIQSTPPADPAPVEMSVTEPTGTGTWTLATAGGEVTVSMPHAAWPTPPTAADTILVLRVDLEPSTTDGIENVVEVTARWALAGTEVTQFRAPIAIRFAQAAGSAARPVTSQDRTSWRALTPITGSSLPASAQDGFTSDATSITVLTRHLTFFGLKLDDERPTAPRHIAGVVAPDGLTIRWIPGSDASGRLGNVVLHVNGAPYRLFGPTEYEAKLGEITPGDTRTFHLVQLDAAGNASDPSPTLRVVPTVAGLSLDAARAALVARGYAVGTVTNAVVANVAPGTVVGPTGTALAVDGAAIDLVVAQGAGAPPQTTFVIRVANAKQLTLTKRTTVSARVQVTRPAQLTATLFSPSKQRLYTWRRAVKPGNNIVRLPLPASVRRPGTYRIVWVARSGSETIRRTITFRLVAPNLQQVHAPQQEVEVVLAGEQPLGNALTPELARTKARVVATADADETFALTAATGRNIEVVVVDVARHGIPFVRDLRLVFPELKIIALSNDSGVRARAVRAGAVLALPRSVTPAALARHIARVAGR